MDHADIASRLRVEHGLTKDAADFAADQVDLDRALKLIWPRFLKRDIDRYSHGMYPGIDPSIELNGAFGKP